MLKMHDVVRTKRDIPALSVTKGMTGAVIAVFDQPVRAYEVEFVDETGATVLQVTLVEDDVDPIDVAARG